MTDTSSPAEHAGSIAAARDRLLAFAADCSDEDWQSRPLAAEGDPRTVGVLVDHVADAYEYMGDWMRRMLAGDSPEVDVALVDRLNAAHALQAGELSQVQVADHLQRSGDVIVGLVRGLTDSELAAGDGRIRLFAQIATRHPDSHRTEIENALQDARRATRDAT